MNSIQSFEALCFYLFIFFFLYLQRDYRDCTSDLPTHFGEKKTLGVFYELKEKAELYLIVIRELSYRIF